MEETKPADGTASPNPTASTQEVKKNASVEPDYLEVLKEKDAKIVKLQQDRDNYRKGMLKYKKQSEENPEDKSFEEEKIKQIVQEALISSEISRESTEKDAIIQKIAKENSELRTTLQNKSQVPSMPGGSSQPQDDVKLETLTKDQKDELTAAAIAIGQDPAKFIDRAVQNLRKIDKK